MKTLLLFGSAVCATLSFGQTNLFSDDFESGTSNWTLNGGTGDNTWVVNNSYIGGLWGLIPNTPNQPAGIGGGPNSNYLHVVNGAMCSSLSICNANFDTGSSSNQNAEMTTSIDATNYTDVTVSFWYLCAGQTGVSYGNLEYSLDGGTTWISTGTEYVGTSTWTQETVSLTAWDNTSAFKIRFKWQNGSGGSDPAFSIDDLVITGVQPLPIELIHFVAQEKQGTTAITWATASERNNSYFVVERSNDAMNWGQVTQAEGAGNSTTTLNYSAVDYAPLKGKSYYRLAQYDFDGAVSLSDIEVVYFAEEKDISIFPNPTSGAEINLQLDGFKNKKTTININDISGKVHFSKEMVLHSNSEEATLSTNLVKGVYLVVVKSKEESYVKRLIVK